MSKPLFTFSLLSNNTILQPCFYSGDDSFFYREDDGFNKWFFSKIGYLLLKGHGNILMDSLLFTLLGGSNKWLSLISDKITIEIFQTVNPVYAELIKAVSAKILLSSGIEKTDSDKFDTIITPDDFDEILSFYYNKYVQSPPKIFCFKDVPKLNQAIDSSKHHNGLFITVRVDRNIYDKGNTLHFDQRPKAKDSLLLVYFYAILSGNEGFCQTVRNCFDKKTISADEQMKIERYINQIDTK